MKQTKEKFESLTGGRIVEGYGLSEAPTATHCNPLQGENRLGSIGLPLPDVDARIVSLEDGITEMPTGEAGELVIRSPQVMLGYHNMPQETEIALRDGWLYTGDIARMDAQGYFYIVDRKKELIKPGGMEVWPREVEAGHQRSSGRGGSRRGRHPGCVPRGDSQGLGGAQARRNVERDRYSGLVPGAAGPVQGPDRSGFPDRITQIHGGENIEKGIDRRNKT